MHTFRRDEFVKVNWLYILSKRWLPYTSEPIHIHTVCFAPFHLLPPIEDLFTGANHIRGLLGTWTQAPQGTRMRKEGLAFLLSLILTPKRFYLPHREKKGIEGREVAITFVLSYSGGNLISSKKVWHSLLIIVP